MKPALTMEVYMLGYQLNYWIFGYHNLINAVTIVIDDTDDDILCDNSYFDNYNLKMDVE